MTSVNYREVKRKAAVGERIKIVDAYVLSGAYANGDVMTVKERQESDPVGVWTNESTVFVYDREYVVLEPVTSALSATLQSDPLYAAFRQLIVDNADAIRAILPELPGAFTVDSAGSVKATGVSVSKPTLTRADVIAKAAADVAELTRIGGSTFADLPKVSPLHGRFYTAEFHVNRDKRVVTALVKRGNAVLAKFTAKCSPADVFHAEIGKAIALRKALGLPVPSEYMDAPQPEPAAGAKVRKLTGGNVGATLTLEERYPSLDGEEYGSRAFTTLEGEWIGDKQYVVIDDTDVDYSGVIAAGGAGNHSLRPKGVA
jgi:hypothetical protein